MNYSTGYRKFLVWIISASIFSGNALESGFLDHIDLRLCKMPSQREARKYTESWQESDATLQIKVVYKSA